MIDTEKKLAALLLFSTLIGLGGGYGLGYTIYQPQIQSLQTMLDTLADRLQALNSSITTMKNKTWHSVTNFTLSSDADSSPLFFVKGEKWRIKWEPPEGTTWTYSWHSFIIYNDNAQVIDEFNVEGVLMRNHESTGCYFVACGDGNYRIEVTGLSTTTNRVNMVIESYY